MHRLITNCLLALSSVFVVSLAHAEDAQPAPDADADVALEAPCYQVLNNAARLYYNLQDFRYTVRQYHYRSHLEFALGNAQRSVGTLYYQGRRTYCRQYVMQNALEGVRSRLDVVRRIFRGSDYYSSEPRLFDAFRSMVEHWESLRDSVIL